jgi:anti-sigma factor (TIGR02949 family)
MSYGSVDLSEISCEEVLHEIELYIDGELGAERHGIFADHLASCTPCLHHASFQARLKEILRSKCRQQTPDHLAVRIRTMIRFERFDQR